MTRFSRIRTLVGTAAIAAMSAGAAIAGDVTLNFAHWVPPKHPLSQGFAAWADAVSEASNGTISFNFFPAAQLGAPPDHYDMAKDGIADITWINPGFNPGRFPLTELPEFMFIMDDPVASSRGLTNWYRNYADKEMGDVHFCFMHTMRMHSLFSTTDPLLGPEDVKGVKMRPSNGTQAKIFNAAGATTVFFPFPEIRDNFERGIATGATGVPGSLIAFGGADATEHVTDEPLFGAVWALVMNKAKYDALDDVQKAAIDGQCNAEASAKFAAPVAAFDENGLQKMKEMGKNVHKLTPEQIAAWVAISDQVMQGWMATAGDNGYDGPAVLEDLKANLKAEGGLFE